MYIACAFHKRINYALQLVADSIHAIDDQFFGVHLALATHEGSEAREYKI
jgi:hypothetical protein